MLELYGEGIGGIMRNETIDVIQNGRKQIILERDSLKKQLAEAQAEIEWLVRQRDNFIKEATKERLKLEMLSNITPMMDSKNIINPGDVATIAKDLKGIIEATKKGDK